MADASFGKKMVQGEFKHGAAYNMNMAATQCFAYLYSALYWIRVVQGFQLESVYGFGVCGHKCSDMKSIAKENGTDKEYAVGFFRLSVPSHLGERFRAEALWTNYTTENLTGMKLLILFLKSKKPNILSQDCIDGRVPVSFPALFAVPNSYWNHPGIVKNGTRAIVFHLSFNQLLDMLNNFEETYLSEYAANRRNDLEKLRPKEDEECDKKKYYVKFRTLDTSYHFGMNDFEKLFLQLEKDYIKDAEANNDVSIYREFFKTYIVEPFQNEDSLVIIMVDRGSRLPKNEPEFETSRERLKNLKIMVDLLANKMCHGDLLSHNFVLDRTTNTLHIIDLDEGGINVVPRRETTANIEGVTEDNKWFLALRYPNALRTHRVLYTKLQFAAAVLSLVPIAVLNKDLTALVEKATLLGKALILKDGRSTQNQFLQVPGNIRTSIDSIDAEVDEFLKGSTHVVAE